MSGKELNVGDPAPDFFLPCWPGEKIRLSDQVGKLVVLYFYPRDNTPGCTLESSAFQDASSKFEQAGAIVMGVSRDSLKSHKRFAEKLNLSFPLISDEGEEACRAFGVIKTKTMYGRQVRGIERSSFLIDTNGHIAAIWRKVRVKGHVPEVLDALDKLTREVP